MIRRRSASISSKNKTTDYTDDPCKSVAKLCLELASDVDQHFRARLDLQFLAALHCQRAGPPSATNDQTNRCPFAAQQYRR